MTERSRHELWFLQAEDDLRWGKDSLDSGHFAQTCFISQQVAEKALKALAMYRGFDQIKSHSIAQIARELKFNGEVVQIAAILDLYSLSTRYPDALPGLAPFEHFTKEMATDAIKMTTRVLDRVRDELVSS